MNVPLTIQKWLDHPKVPSWIGSIVFHLIVLLIILLCFRLQPITKSAPGDRIALGGIVLKRESVDGTSYIDSENNQFGEASPLGDKSTAPTLQETLSGEFSSLDMARHLPNTAIGPRTASGTASGAVSGAEIAANLQRGGSGGGFGRDVGGKVSVQVFGTEGKGTRFVYVFDRSGSMNEFGGLPIRAAKVNLIQSLEPLGNLHQFNVIFYNDDFVVLSRGKLPFATEAFKESSKKFVEGIVPSGGTKHLPPLLEAIRLKPDVIFFLSDGDENDALRPGELEEISRLNSRIGAGVQINVIQFGVGEQSPDSNFLQKLAAQNQGQYKYVNIAGLR